MLIQSTDQYKINTVIIIYNTQNLIDLLEPVQRVFIRPRVYTP